MEPVAYGQNFSMAVVQIPIALGTKLVGGSCADTALFSMEPELSSPRSPSTLLQPKHKDSKPSTQTPDTEIDPAVFWVDVQVRGLFHTTCRRPGFPGHGRFAGKS